MSAIKPLHDEKAITMSSWAKADPYVAAGVYRETTVKPFRKVLP